MLAFSRHPSCGGPTYGKSASRSVWGRSPSLRNFPIREHGKEITGGVVGERPAVARVRCFAPRLIRQHVRKQGGRGPRCILRRVPTRVLQRMGEDGDEPGVVCRLSCDVRAFLIPGKERLLRGQGASVRLNPTSGRTIQRSAPEPKLLRSQFSVGYFKCDGTDVFVGEEILTGELQVVDSAQRVEKERVAAPPCEEAVLAGARHPWLAARRNRRTIENNHTVFARAAGPHAVNATHGCNLLSSS